MTYRSAHPSEILVREPVDRVARWVTIQPPDEESAKPQNRFARAEVPAPTADFSVPVMAQAGRHHIRNLRRRIREIEALFRGPRLPKAQARWLAAEKTAASQAIYKWRNG